MVTCQICSSELKSVRSLSRHIRDVHRVDSETYWNLSSVRPVCPCGNPTKFVNISLGYKNFCGHSCSARAWRAELKEDTGRFDSFRQKVAANMVKEWNARPENVRTEIFAKAANTNRSRISELSDEERIAKYNRTPPGFTNHSNGTGTPRRKKKRFASLN